MNGHPVTDLCPTGEKLRPRLGTVRLPAQDVNVVAMGQVITEVFQQLARRFRVRPITSIEEDDPVLGLAQAAGLKPDSEVTETQIFEDQVLQRVASVENKRRFLHRRVNRSKISFGELIPFGQQSDRVGVGRGVFTACGDFDIVSKKRVGGFGIHPRRHDDLRKIVMNLLRGHSGIVDRQFCLLQ